MAKLAYYGSRLPDKPHQAETPIEGYRIYLSVPICRTGLQEYAGRELKKFPGYDPAWGIGDNDIVKVYRPKEVVTAPETIASFESKSVTDDHPPAGVALVTIENESEYGRGHAQNVHVGEAMEDGEIPLIADLIVKNQELNDKIDSGIRDVSCGYVCSLGRNEDGTIFMSEICGNHVAVVPKGRAGPEVSIRDSALETEAPQSIRTQAPERKGNEQPMKKGNVLTRMLAAFFATDADPEEKAEALRIVALDAAKDESESEKKDDDKKAAKDAEEEKKKEDEKAAKDADENGEVSLHPDLAEAVDHIRHMRSAMDSLMEHFGAKKEGEEAAAADDADVLEMHGPEKGKSELPAQISSDSLLSFLRALKPVVASAKDGALIGQFNTLVRAAKGKPAADANPYADLTRLAPEAIVPALDGTSKDPDPMSFFNGVPYAEGKRRYDEYLAKKGNK